MKFSLSKLSRVQKSLDAIEQGRYSEFDIHYCCNYIGWLARWKKVSKDIWGPLCDQATRILELERIV